MNTADASAIVGHVIAIRVSDLDAESILQVEERKALGADLSGIILAVDVGAEVVGQLERRVAAGATVVEGDEGLAPQALASVELKHVARVALDAICLGIVPETVPNGTHTNHSVILCQQVESSFAAGAV